MSVRWLACQCIKRKISESGIIQDAKEVKPSQSLLIIVIDRKEVKKMGIGRDCFGNLEYTIPRKCDIFEVTKPKGNELVRIIRHDLNANGRYDAMVMNPEYHAFWEECPKFDSFIKAVAYLKANIEYLL